MNAASRCVRLLFALTIITLSVPAMGLQWQVETIASSSSKCGPAALVVDSSDHPRFAYIDWATGELKYVTPASGGGWNTQTVATSVVSPQISMVLDSQQNPHLAYSINYWNIPAQRDTSALQYASWTGTQWSREMVDPGGGLYAYASLALDANSDPHIAYSSLGARYAVRKGGVWTLEPIDYMTGNIPRNCGGLSLAIGSDGVPRVAYSFSPTDYWSSAVKLATRSSTSWSTEFIRTPAMSAWTPALALDGNNKPNVTLSNGDLVYATKSGSTWETTTVDSVGDVGGYSSIVIDSQGSPHICYQDKTLGALKYAVWDHDQWSIETVDDSGASGAYCSMQLDSQGNAHILYADISTGQLKYAMGDIPEPATLSLLAIGALAMLRRRK